MAKSNKADKKDDKSKKPQEKSSGGSALSRKWHHVPVILVGFVGFGIIVASVAGLMLSLNTNTEPVAESITTDSIHDESGLTYTQKAYSLSNLEGTDEAVEFLENSAQQASDNSKVQAEFYSQAVIISLNDGQPEKALELAKKAYDLDPTYETASLVATVAQALGNNDLELEYLRLALDGIPEEQVEVDPDGSGYNYISERIKVLEEQ